MKRALILLLVIGLTTFQTHNHQAQASSSDQLTGLVIHVGDGDSITLLDEQQQRHRIRLAEIDAPELGQAYGQASRRALKELIGQQQVRIHLLDTDQYGRIVGIV
ncbi:MAG: thermonuclease family protein, partial [Moraxellaceae bacterium]|nr:thermonuclease family protein [Moraxellaceae bacterium]